MTILGLNSYRKVNTISPLKSVHHREFADISPLLGLDREQIDAAGDRLNVAGDHVPGFVILDAAAGRIIMLQSGHQIAGERVNPNGAFLRQTGEIDAAICVTRVMPEASPSPVIPSRETPYRPPVEPDLAPLKERMLFTR